MSTRAIAWAWDQGLGDNSGAKLVLVRLADAANDDWVCWPGHVRIARDCAMGERTVRRHIQTLVNSGLLVYERRGNRQTNLYFLTGHNDLSLTGVTGHLGQSDRPFGASDRPFETKVSGHPWPGNHKRATVSYKSSEEPWGSGSTDDVLKTISLPDEMIT